MPRYIFLIILCVLFFNTPSVHASAENPVLQITAPISGNFVGGRTKIVFTNESATTPLTAECSLDGFITSVACVSDQTLLGDVPGFDGLADGVLTLSVRDEHLPRTYISDTEVGINKDTIAPVVTSTSPSTGASLSSSFELRYTLDTEIASGTITFTRVDGAPDTAAHAYTMLRADGESGQHILTRSALETGFGNSLVEDAMYTISYIVRDSAGNEGSATVSSVVYDAVPSVSVTNVSISSNASVSTMAAVGHIVTVTAFSELGSSVVGTIGGKTATGTKIGRDIFLKRTMDGTETEGDGLNFTLTLRDASGNPIATVTKANILNGSAVTTAFSPPMTPRMAPVAGTYVGTQNVFFENPGSLIKIRYTTNGTIPTCTTGTLYSGAITLSSTTTIKAKSCDAVGNISALGTFVYTITPSSGSSGGGGSTSSSIPGTPIASPASGTYTGTQYVTLSSTGATSIRYTTNNTIPTCSIGTVYTGAIQVSSTISIKAKGCNVAGLGSANATFTYTIKPGSTSSSTPGTALPLTPTPNSSTPTTITPKPVVTPVVSVVSIHDPALYTKLLTDFGLKSDVTNFEKYKSLAQSDANAFGVAISTEQTRTISNFITYGASTETIKLGVGERHALIRDYLETVGRADVVWDDVQRLTIGQKPVKRNLAKEQALAAIALAHFKKMVGHAPNFQDASEDLAWNTMMYRIRFPRDLVKEQKGIVQFKTIFNRLPTSPLDWAEVRALGYILK